MGLALRAEDFDGVLALPPAPNWAKDLEAADTLDEFRNVVDQAERSMAAWRTHMRKTLASGIEMILAKAEGEEPHIVELAIVPMIDEALLSAEELRVSYGVPFDNLIGMFSDERFARLQPGARRLMRKQAGRVQVLQSQQIACIEELQRGLQDFRQQLIDETEFSQHVHESIADHPVINAYLAR
ncbi:hypothetical protein NGM99_13725 [Mesorhizobium sp. RP14(2022)]|uniref:Uncharacterized protein n=1 Tax=Mesorhizobium liriopis TaxID=2953882 RepID=A0ABT1C7M1_9HYPH|nr:hypothetical protein [Mesorhizobium liriopis]MCO6050838.1 hypothetical protein [Mesorhizobium liriopis]